MPAAGAPAALGVLLLLLAALQPVGSQDCAGTCVAAGLGCPVRRGNGGLGPGNMTLGRARRDTCQAAAETCCSFALCDAGAEEKKRINNKKKKREERKKKR